MRQLLRASTSLLLAVLTVIEATPVLAVASPRQMRSSVCELRAAETPQSLVVVPASRSADGANGGTAERSPFVPSVAIVPTPRAEIAVATSSDVRRAAAQPDGWLRLHRHRARAPDDADPF